MPLQPGLLAGFLVVLGYWGYSGATEFRGKTGRTPWGWPPLAWGLCLALTGGIVGGLLLFTARRTTRPAVGATETPATEAEVLGGPTLGPTILPRR